jgi:hypothetical protein
MYGVLFVRWQQPLHQSVSQVGQAVIQIAAAKGYKTINFIRDRCVIFTTLMGLSHSAQEMMLNCSNNIWNYWVQRTL